MITFNYKKHKYTILNWYEKINQIEIKKDTGSVARVLHYPPLLTVKQFLSNLEKINFCEY